MATSDLKSLPPQVRKRLEKLEATVSELRGVLGVIVSEMQRQGMAIPIRKVPAAATGLAGAIARGEAAKVQWVASGEVVPAKALADKWGLTPQALGPAAGRGEVFAVVVQRQRFYPREFLDLDRADVATVSKSLGDLSPEEKLVFWKRPHGALGGKTVSELLGGRKNGAQLVHVARLAQSWAAQAHAENDVAEAA
jgi:hypothetical protein